MTLLVVSSLEKMLTLPTEMLLSLAEHESLSLLAVFCSCHSWAVRGRQVLPIIIESLARAAGAAHPRHLSEFATILWRLTHLDRLQFSTSYAVNLLALRNAVAAGPAQVDLQLALRAIGVQINDDRYAQRRRVLSEGLGEDEGREYDVITGDAAALANGEYFEGRGEGKGAAAVAEEETAKRTHALCIIAARFVALARGSSGRMHMQMRIAPTPPHAPPTMMRIHESFSGVVDFSGTAADASVYCGKANSTQP